jgi:hypothetical protein
LFDVTRGAWGCPGTPNKLAFMAIFVTVLAEFCCSLELNLCLSGRGLVARTAGYGAMTASQWEISLGMVEAVYIRPGTGAVAGFATEYCSVSPAAFHARFEFAVMRVNVTSRTGATGELERKDFVEPPSGSHFVAFRARNG